MAHRFFSPTLKAIGAVKAGGYPEQYGVLFSKDFEMKSKALHSYRRRKPLRWVLGCRGFSLVSAMVTSLVIVLSAAALYRTVTSSLKAVSQTKLKDESNHFRKIIFDTLDCDASLAPLKSLPSFDDTVDCVTTLNPAGGLPATKLFNPVDIRGAPLFSSYNQSAEVGKLGDYNAKAGCFKRERSTLVGGVLQPSGRVTHCVVIHTSILDDRQAGGFRNDPRTGQPMGWISLFNFPLCCD
jgi:hypothetical protein